MGQKGYISEFMNGGRIVSHGQIKDLSAGFRLPNGEPFSIYVRPKTNVETLDAVLPLRCYQDSGFSDAPVVLNDWSPLAVVEIAPVDASLLDSFDVYWGCGSYVPEL